MIPNLHGKLADYMLGRKLGSGQYSKVREGFKADEKFAVKYIKKSSDVYQDKTYMDLVFTEAKVMSVLNHPNIIKLHEISDKGVVEHMSGKTTPVLYLVLDLISGGELFDYVAVSGRFSDKFARHYFRQLIDAIGFVHSKGFAHRDIKAENVLLDDNYTLKLADFGFSAPTAGKDGSGKLHTYKGTPGYMAPEINAGQAYSGEKVDLFAVGVLLFIMVAQHPPFKQAKATDGLYKMFCQQNEIYWKKVEAGKPPGTFPPVLKALINSLLSFNPTTRPSITEIKSHPWYNGPLPTPEEIKMEFAARRAKVEIDQKAKAAEALAKKKLAKTDMSKMKAGFAPHTTGTKGGISVDESVSANVKKIIPVYQPNVFEQTVMFTVEEPQDVMNSVKQYFNEQGCAINESEKKYKMQAEFSTYDQKLVVKTRIEKCPDQEGVYCVKLEKVAGGKMDFLGVFNEVKNHLTDANMLV